MQPHSQFAAAARPLPPPAVWDAGAPTHRMTLAEMMGVPQAQSLPVQPAYAVSPCLRPYRTPSARRSIPFSS